MLKEIESLDDQEALQAVEFFFKFSEPEMWIKNSKPNADRVRQFAEGAVKNSPDDIKSAVAALVDGNQTVMAPARAQVARLVLDRLSQTPAFQATVNNAVQDALSADKFLVDPVTGAFVLAILLATSKIEQTPEGWKFSFAGNMAEIIHEVPDVIKALPEGILSALTKNH